MTQGKSFIIALVTLIIGFGAVFTLRPVIRPASAPAVVASPASAVSVSIEPRGKSYFAAHLEEARGIVAGCRDGSVRGDECANAEQAVVEAEGRDRFKKFMGH
ncbi:hypothetical protein HRJ34_02640 [Rhizorhabdus wittichii]|uniref:Uncharacterized protein n=1 Tax=Rhizorhabdus wittichii TaxID=160791 RepID=A0A975D4C1_9SPHN|nr:hypothetical protein [Rhizorhabdus wittichii]QTH22444.1 hypothetical protein HRJ34_02640 [Rhizorhabdus wittichii]